jgi:hypothetical protein
MGGGAEKFDMLNRDMFVANGWPEKVALPLGVDGRPMLDDDMLESVAFEESGWPVVVGGELEAKSWPRSSPLGFMTVWMFK